MKEITKQSLCPRCGRGQELENVGTNEVPAWKFPVHKIRKNAYSKKVVICKNSDKPE